MEVGTAYKAGDVWKEEEKKVTLYANWSATSYEVIFNANGGQVTPESSPVVYDGQYPTLPTPTKEGYTFKGWFTDITGGEQITSTNKYKTVGNQTIYAHWELITYQITYNANNGTGAPGVQTKTWNQILQLSNTKPTRNGYTFVSWNTKADGTGTNYNPGANYIANAGITLYAKWQAITYQVTYNANGGSGAPGAQTKIWGQTLKLSSTKPTSKYATFLGWSTNSTATSATYQSGGNYTGNSNITLYAVWQKYPDLVLYNKGTFSKAATANHAYSGTIYAVTYNSDHIQFGYREIRNLFFNDAISNKYRYLKVIAKTNRNSSVGKWYNSVFFVSSDKTHSGYVPSKIIKKYEILNPSSTTDYTTWKEFTLDLQSLTNTSFYVGIWNCDTDLYIQKVWLSN